MANKQKEMSGITRVVAVVVAVLLVLGIVLGSMQLWGKGKVKPSEWFKGETQTEEKADPEKEGEQDKDAGGSGFTHGGMIAETPSQEHRQVQLTNAVIPIEMYDEYGIDPMSTDSAMTLTATIEPANADNQKVDWAIAWSNSSSAWATGKDIAQYATVVPKSDGALTATVTCKQAFGEPFIVTVTSRQSEELSAQCTFDYVKRITDIGIRFSADSVAFDTTYTVTATPTYGVGTVQGDFAEKSYKIALTNDFKNAIEAIYQHGKRPDGTDLQENDFYYRFATEGVNGITYNVTQKSFQFSASAATTFAKFSKHTSGSLISDPMGSEIMPLALTKSVTKTIAVNAFNNAFKQALTNLGSSKAPLTFTLEYTYTYEGKSYAGEAKKVDMKFDTSSLVVLPTGVGLNEEHYVF